MDRAAILANDDLNYREGWVHLITSLNDEDIQAKVIIEIRNEHIRKKLLEEMEADTREEILERISQICE
jgi:Mg/Co/Ni transporter MgtE